MSVYANQVQDIDSLQEAEKQIFKILMKLKDVIYEKVKSEMKQMLNASNKYISMSSILNEDRKLSPPIRK